MGLMDKVKAQASTLGQKAQETANAAQAKLDSAQANRRADALLRSLGLAYLAERTGRATPETSGQIDRLLADLAQHESQHNVNLVLQSPVAQQMQMQTGGGEFLTSSQAAADPNVSAAPVGFPQQADPGYGQAYPQQADPGYGQAYPQQADPGYGQAYPQQDPAAGFGGPAQTSFPQAGGSTSFPEATPATSFPAAAPTGFPEQVAEPAPEPTEQAGGTMFPPASGA
jgi:hypothetical protein